MKNLKYLEFAKFLRENYRTCININGTTFYKEEGTNNPVSNDKIFKECKKSRTKKKRN